MNIGDGARSSREPGTIALELQKLLIGADGVESFLADAARYAAGAVPHAQSVGITVSATRFCECWAPPAMISPRPSTPSSTTSTTVPA
jgi:hypothetical protein